MKQLRLHQAILGLWIAWLLVGCGSVISPVPTYPAPPTRPSTATAPPTEAINEAALTQAALIPTLTPTDLFATVEPPLDVGQNLPAMTSAPPAIDYFVSTQPEALPEELVVLFWTSQNGTEAAIYRLNEDGTPGRTWSVEPEGSLTVLPRSGFASETYVLALTNGISTVEESVTISVLCPFRWFFSPEPDGLCPEGEATLTAANIQTFERGRMIYLQVTNEIIVIIEDLPETQADDQPLWLRVANTYTDDQPLDDPNLGQPEGLLQPQRGFGLVWRNTPGLIDRIGWAVSPEESYTAVLQFGLSEDGQQQLFVTNPANEVITLLPGGDGWLIAGFVDN